MKLEQKENGKLYVDKVRKPIFTLKIEGSKEQLQDILRKLS